MNFEEVVISILVLVIVSILFFVTIKETNQINKGKRRLSEEDLYSLSLIRRWGRNKNYPL